MPEDDSNEGSAAGPSTASEALACVACRSRKLKCDRRKPTCSRCAKVHADCIYPESRRKPAFKRRNVKELEARLAQVEDILKDVGKAETERKRSSEALHSQSDDAGLSPDFDTSSMTPDDLSGVNGLCPFMNYPKPQASLPRNPGTSEVMGTGMSEPPPPFEMAEALHRIFFEDQGHYFPVVHPGRYLRSFHSAPHLKPPMCLQYAIWSLASYGTEKYSQYSEVFYKRARQYLEADELRDTGEHFLTVAHAQAWELIATREAQTLAFARASMSTARCVKLCHMMNLHRMDDKDSEGDVIPTIAPPQGFAETEEWRRVLWGAFCIDSHASVNTGWPSIFDYTQVTTKLPCSEEAFRQGTEEPSCSLREALAGSSYSTFAAAAFICHLFNQILRHVQGDRATDRPEDFESGPFWRRHRELDTLLSTAFMFLPEKLRLPRFSSNHAAVQTNLNLHAAVVCLHNAVCDRVDVYGLPKELKRPSEDRLLTAGNEIVNIIKMTSHNPSIHKSPHVAMSLYCAITVYIYRVKNHREEADLANVEFLVKSMEAMGRQHVITTAFLAQALQDMESNGITTSVKVPWFDKYSKWQEPSTDRCNNMIPLLASRRSKIMWPMPGRPPISTVPRPRELRIPAAICNALPLNPDEMGTYQCNDRDNKRRRMEPPQSTSAGAWLNGLQAQHDQGSSTGSSQSSPSAVDNARPTAASGTADMAGVPFVSSLCPHRGLPHRGNINSPVASASASTSLASVRMASTTPQSTSYRAASTRIETMTIIGSQDISPASAVDGSIESSREQIDVNLLGNLFGGIDDVNVGWDMSVDPASFYSQLMDVARGAAVPEADPWSLLDDGDLAPWDTGEENQQGDGG